MKRENDTFGLVLRMRQMVYSSKDYESLWFLYQAEGLPKNLSIEEFCEKHGVDYLTFNKWYKKTHKKVYPVTITGRPEEDEAIQAESERVGEECEAHKPVSHPFKYPTDQVTNINKKISISIKFPDGMRIVKTGISFTELKHLIERLEVVC